MKLERMWKRAHSGVIANAEERSLLCQRCFSPPHIWGGGILLVILAPSVLVLLMGSIAAVLFDLVHYLGRRRRLP